MLSTLDAALLYLLLFAGYLALRLRQQRWDSFWRLPIAMSGELHSQFCWRHVLVRVHWLLLQVALAALLVVGLQFHAELTLQVWLRPFSLALVFSALTTACWCVVGYVWFLKVWLIGPDRRHL